MSPPYAFPIPSAMDAPTGGRNARWFTQISPAPQCPPMRAVHSNKRRVVIRLTTCRERRRAAPAPGAVSAVRDVRRAWARRCHGVTVITHHSVAARSGARGTVSHHDVGERLGRVGRGRRARAVRHALRRLASRRTRLRGAQEDLQRSSYARARSQVAVVARLFEKPALDERVEHDVARRVVETPEAPHLAPGHLETGALDIL